MQRKVPSGKTTLPSLGQTKQLMIDHSLETRDEFIEDLSQKIKESELKQEEPQTELLIAMREAVDQQ